MIDHDGVRQIRREIRAERDAFRPRAPLPA
jgi:hypothetical protein